jgi:Lrp/AsnC family transcriptional regulator for asnA, asnC and gidA
MRIRSAKAHPTGLDKIDAGIVEILQANGRATNQEIAERLSVSAATISSRIRRLEQSRAMRVVAVSDYSAHGFNVLIAIGVKVRGRPPADVGQDLAKLHEVLSIQTTTGPNDLEMLVGLRDFSQINTFLTVQAAGIAGVYELQSGLATDVLKYEFNVVRL